MKFKILLFSRTFVINDSPDSSGYFMYHQFLTFSNYTFCTLNAFMSCIDLKKNIDNLSKIFSLLGC
jgi:hypothetical protein